MTEPHRVLFVEKSFGLSGSTISLATLLTHLDRKIYSADVVVSRPEQRDFLRSKIDKDVAVEVIDERTSLARASGSARVLSRLRRHVPILQRPALWLIAVFDFLFSTLPYALRLARFGHRRNTRLLHQNNGFDVGALIASILLRVPLVAFQRGDEPTSLISRLLARRVRCYVANSSATRASLVTVGVRPTDIEVVYPPVDLSRFDPSQTGRIQLVDLGLPPTAPCFGIVGQLVEWKGHRVFLDAAQRVFLAMPHACALVVGEAPPDRRRYRAALEEQAVRLGIYDRVKFLGFRDDVADLLRLMDVVVHASIWAEPFGRVLVEAMAMKKPVVASMAGGPLEIVEDGKTGFLVPPGDAVRLAERILGLLAAPERARQMGDAGLKAAARFDVRFHMDRIHAIYTGLVPPRQNEHAYGDRTDSGFPSNRGRR